MKKAIISICLAGLSGAALNSVGAQDIKLLERAAEAADRYEFERARDLVDQYESAAAKARKRNRKAAAADEPELLSQVNDAIERGEAMMERVEKITVIDSIAVDRATFLSAYRLARSAGRLGDASALPAGMAADKESTVHISPDGESMIWAMPDSTGSLVIAEATRLADGSWEGPVIPAPDLGLGGDAAFPFLMPDGVTLYYASDGDDTLGGYDIFITRRDGDTFLQPQNVGMPYNSPYDDYMLAIDEETGTGWWATDRNRLDDKITIYRFIPSEMRVNYPADTPGLSSLARLDNYRATWQPGEDYSRLLALPADDDNRADGPSFRLAMPDGSVVTSLSQLSTPAARSAMADYLDMKSELERLERNLSAMRAAYGRGDKSRAQEIRASEQRLASLRKELARLRNNVVSANMRR